MREGRWCCVWSMARWTSRKSTYRDVWIVILLRRLRRRLAGIDEAAGLPAPERRVVAVELQQRLVRALLDDAAMVEHDQPVHARNGPEPMRDRDHRLAGHQRAKALLDRGLNLAVERGGGFI